MVKSTGREPPCPSDARAAIEAALAPDEAVPITKFIVTLAKVRPVRAKASEKARAAMPEAQEASGEALRRHNAKSLEARRISYEEAGAIFLEGLRLGLITVYPKIDGEPRLVVERAGRFDIITDKEVADGNRHFVHLTPAMPPAPKERGVLFGRPPKLTPHQTREAITRRDNGETLTSIARSFNVSHSTISRL